MIEIARATPEDAAEIARVHIHAWQDGYRGQIPDAYLDALSRTVDRRERYWRDEVRRNPVWVARLHGDVVGFAAAGPSRDEGADGGEVYVINFVARAWGTGAAQRAFDEAVAYLRDAGFAEATLWVLDTNERARRFYERNGWSFDGTTKEDVAQGFTLHELRYRTKL